MNSSKFNADIAITDGMAKVMPFIFVYIIFGANKSGMTKAMPFCYAECWFIPFFNQYTDIVCILIRN